MENMFWLIEKSMQTLAVIIISDSFVRFKDLLTPYPKHLEPV